MSHADDVAHLDLSFELFSANNEIERLNHRIQEILTKPESGCGSCMRLTNELTEREGDLARVQRLVDDLITEYRAMSDTEWPGYCVEKEIDALEAWLEAREGGEDE